MQIFEIAPEVLKGHVQRMGQDRVNELVSQAKEQISEIATRPEVLESYLGQVGLEKRVDDLVVWILFMMDEDICDAYNEIFEKGFFKMIPLNDLSDLTIYVANLIKTENKNIDGVDNIINCNTGTSKEVDHHSVTNLLYYIQQEKQNQMQF